MSLNYKISPLDREILLSLAINRQKEYILAHPEKKLTQSQLKKFSNFVKRRFSGEPIAYITGKKEFFGMDFLVNKSVLIPRPETELLVEEVVKKIPNTKCRIPDTIIDVGTGSGNLIISIAKNISKKNQNKINFFAVDVSEKALEVAKANARKHKVDKKIKFIHSDILDYFLKKKNKKLKNVFIVANLPYVSHKLYKENKNDLKFEPKKALLSGQGGLSHYKKLFKQIRLLSVDHYLLLIEISSEQKFPMSRILRQNFPEAKIDFFKDLAGKWRVARLEIIRKKT